MELIQLCQVAVPIYLFRRVFVVRISLLMELLRLFLNFNQCPGIILDEKS